MRGGRLHLNLIVIIYNRGKLLLLVDTVASKEKVLTRLGRHIHGNDARLRLRLKDRLLLTSEGGELGDGVSISSVARSLSCLMN